MDLVHWGIVGCGNVTEIKSGPGFQKAEGSRLVAVMRRDRAKAEDYARRHGVPRVHDNADALIQDPEVDAVYIATPPSSHLELALRVAAAGKPCLVEKPMAMTHAECARMNDAFRAAGVPLFVAYYRRALPRFLEVRRQLESGAIGAVTDVHVRISEPLATGEARRAGASTRPSQARGSSTTSRRTASTCVDFLLGPIAEASGFAVNTRRRVRGRGRHGRRVPVQPRHRWHRRLELQREPLRGLDGVHRAAAASCITPVFTDGDVVVRRGGLEEILPLRNPPHVHQPLIQTIVDELRGRGRCESTGESGARASWVMDRLLESYRARQK
ncbi:MAG: Gfo/Idh/MocA family oxidoreductase [Desulfobacterales bacterium]|nr:Gfo/Idh/MocA family oxidoreductase [Desulfobacterales bacterium]